MMLRDDFAPSVTRRSLLVSSGNLFVASCVVSACSSLLPAPKTLPIYVLEPHLSAVPAGPLFNSQLVVALPRAEASLDTSRIALRKMPAMLDYYADAAWTDRLPIVMQDLLIGCFESSGRMVGIGRDDSGIAANYRLETELRQFEAHYVQADSAPRVVVQLDAHLIALPSETIVARTAIMQTAQTHKNDLNDIILSFDEATGSTLDQIVNWTFSELSSRGGEPASPAPPTTMPAP